MIEPRVESAIRCILYEEVYADIPRAELFKLDRLLNNYPDFINLLHPLRLCVNCDDNVKIRITHSNNKYTMRTRLCQCRKNQYSDPDHRCIIDSIKDLRSLLTIMYFNRAEYFIEPYCDYCIKREYI